MIAVIADDFTGAAEIGGIAVRLKRTVVIDTKVPAQNGSDVLIIATNTRTMEAEDAAETIEALVLQLAPLKPRLIYKKMDSVMRGNVAEELIAHLKAEGKKRALLIPANPSLNRIIKNGVYFYEGKPLLESRFAASSKKDRVNSSMVLDMISGDFVQDTAVVSVEDEFPERTLMIGNATDDEALMRWAKRIDSDTIPAGGSSFFHAILKSGSVSGSGLFPEVLPLGNKRLYVCGSAFLRSREVVAKAKSEGQCVAYMPDEMFLKNTDLNVFMEGWANALSKGIQEKGTAVVAVGSPCIDTTNGLSDTISWSMARVVEMVMVHQKIDELIVEGGETAAAIMNQLKFKRFTPVQELAPGVIRMEVDGNEGLFLTVKPGSYVWPPAIWKY